MQQARKQAIPRWSQLFIPTLREAPADAEVASHKLLLRGGYIRQLGAGIYSYLPLGQRSINKIVAIVREEMDAIGQEFLLPTIHPKEIWEASGRWAGMGDNMFRLKDRKGAELCLGMTHEEVMTDIARSELRSYKQLPQIWYQIQTKFRDEPRPKSGLLRVRQFIMKDAYSFDIDEAGLDASYDKHDAVYRRIFDRCGLEYVAVEADSGSMGGSQSQEFMVYTEAGEDLIASCPNCGYAANVEKAISRLPVVSELAPTDDSPLREIHTPGQKTIDELSYFLKVGKEHLVKTLAFTAPVDLHRYVTPGTGLLGGMFVSGGIGKGLQHIFVLLRGDHELNETKLSALLSSRGIQDHRLADGAELELIGAVPGYMGPMAFSKPNPFGPEPLVILDSALEGRSNLIAGANRTDYHFTGVTPMRDFVPAVVADIRTVKQGEACPSIQGPLPGVDPRLVRFPFRPDGTCTGTLTVGKAVEIGHIFKLGYKYSKSMGATVLNKDGKEVTPIMGSYGIGIERILTAAIETSAAKFAAAADAKPGTDSYVVPPSIAPFEVVVTVTNIKEPDLLAAGEKIANELASAGFDVLLDDRDERAGVKFKDADLIGIPYRINIGKKLAEGKLELVDRLTNTTHDVVLADTTATLHSLFPIP